MPSTMLLQRTAGGDIPLNLFRRATPVDLPLSVGVAGGGAPVPQPGVDAIDALLGKRPFYVAHRLGGHDFPEHTLEGARAALSAGYKALEFSTYPTKDGVFIGSHDWTTERTTGVKHEIWDTTWETIQGLNQAGGKFIRLEQLAQLILDDVVVFLDHKGTSSRETPSADGLRTENMLFDLLPKLFKNPQKQIVWKVFAEASSAERARQRGYRVNCMLYPDTAKNADFDRWDILGMEWNASQDVWSRLKATGKSVMGHIVYNQSQAQTALARGADGLMVSVPLTVYPGK